MKIYTKDKIILTSSVNIYNPSEVNYIYSASARYQEFPENTYGKIAISFNGVNYYTFDILNKVQFEVDENTILPVDNTTNTVIPNNSLDITSLSLLNASNQIALNNFFPKKTYFYLMIALKSDITDNSSIMKFYNKNNFTIETLRINSTNYNLYKIFTDINPSYFSSFSNCSIDSTSDGYQAVSFDNGNNQQYQSNNLNQFVKSNTDLTSTLLNTQISTSLLKSKDFKFIDNSNSLIFGILTQSSINNVSIQFNLNTIKYSTNSFKIGEIEFKIITNPWLKNISIGNEIEVIELGNKIKIKNKTSEDKLLKVVIS